MKIFIANLSLANEVIGRTNELRCEIGSAYYVSKSGTQIFGVLCDFKIPASEIMNILREPDYITMCFDRNTKDYCLNPKINITLYDNTVISVPMIYI